VVDDIGRPGYFVKELPLLPAATAALYWIAGGVDERLGRGLPALAWLAATPVVYALVSADRGATAGVFAAFWYVAAPLGVAYSRAFMSDAAMVAASLAALAQGFRWRRRPTGGNAAGLGALTALALLLKPHAVFWLAPGLALALLGRSAAADDAPESPLPEARSAKRSLALPVLALGVGVVVAGAWYLHAAAIHRRYPVPGAMVATGWVDPALLLRPETPMILLHQVLFMVLTPLGALLALVGLRHRAAWAPAEIALLAWGAGVLLHCLVFATRLYDETARGTEYYNLAAVPAAAVLIARGLEFAIALARRAAARVALAAGLLAALLLSSTAATANALAVPARYGALLADCAFVRAATRPDDELVVIADRGGTVLYYCDRRGTTFLPSGPADAPGPTNERATPSDLRRAFTSATHLLLPFPEIWPRTAELERWLASDWRRIETPGGFELYARTGDPGGPITRGAP
jgi:4-amino-4-deoxy-L-arabinose transferase-like glycosyltransferase